MQLSEAIRLGSLMGPQGFSRIYDPDTGRSCALGAALIAMGFDLTKETSPIINGTSPILHIWPWVMQDEDVACPECGHITGRLYNVIAGLNDMHRWTRERIADWVESEERRRADTATETEPISDPVLVVASAR